MIIHRVGSNQAYTDGFIGAALTMAIGERMRGDDVAWNIHISGVAQAIKERRSRGIRGLPSIFTDLIIL